MDMKQFDGFYFLPGDNEGEMKFAYFNLNDETHKGQPVDNTTIGDMFHIAFFKQGDDGLPTFDESFEAIFADPTTYITHNFVGGDLYGCILRKTENSYKWWNSYLEKAKKNCAAFQSDNLYAANT